MKRILALIIGASIASAALAADTKISAYSSMSTLGGTEIFLGNQSGTTKTGTAAQIATYVNGALSSIALSQLATQATNTIDGNATSGTAAPTALAIGTCSTSGSALKWTTNTGFGCNTAIDAATLGSATFAAPGSIGSGTPAAGAFTTLSSTSIPTVNGKSSTVTQFRWGIPVIMPSSGSMGNNGALTITTAITNLATICNSTTGCYMYMPAGAIVAAGAAGVYYARCTNTTTCTLFNSVLSSGPPVAGTATAFSTTGPGAYTQTTGAAVTLLTLSIPGNSIGANGSLAVRLQLHRISNANTVSTIVSYGGTAFGTDSAVSVQWEGYKHSLFGMGATNAQYGINSTAATDEANINAVPTFMAIDSTAAQNLLVTDNLVTAATDWVMILGGSVNGEFAQ